MNIVLAVLTLVIVIASYEIWCVLEDIRNALRAVAVDVDNPNWKLYGVADELDRIGDILGGILADMPTRSPKPEPRPYWRTSWSVSKGKVSEENSQLDGFKVVDRRSFAAEDSSCRRTTMARDTITTGARAGRWR